jgi:hypothetical protein
LDALTAGNPLDDGFEFAHSIEWNEHTDVSPDDLKSAIAVDPLGAGIPARDDAVEGFADDGIRRRLDDCRKARYGIERVTRDVEIECTNPTEGTELDTSCGFCRATSPSIDS